jgi:hypothetical protein
LREVQPRRRASSQRFQTRRRTVTRAPLTEPVERERTAGFAWIRKHLDAQTASAGSWHAHCSLAGRVHAAGWRRRRKPRAGSPPLPRAPAFPFELALRSYASLALLRARTWVWGEVAWPSSIACRPCGRTLCLALTGFYPGSTWRGLVCGRGPRCGVLCPERRALVAFAAAACRSSLCDCILGGWRCDAR